MPRRCLKRRAASSNEAKKVRNGKFAGGNKKKRTKTTKVSRLAKDEFIAEHVAKPTPSVSFLDGICIYGILFFEYSVSKGRGTQDMLMMIVKVSTWLSSFIVWLIVEFKWTKSCQSTLPPKLYAAKACMSTRAFVIGRQRNVWYILS